MALVQVEAHEVEVAWERTDIVVDAVQGLYVGWTYKAELDDSSVPYRVISQGILSVQWMKFDSVKQR